MYYFSLIVNIIGLVLGLLMLLHPLFATEVLRYFISAYLILLGIEAIILAISKMDCKY